MVRDTRGEDDVDETEYVWEKIHRSDITTFEIVYAPEDNAFQLKDLDPPEDPREPDIKPDPTSSYIAMVMARKSFDDLLKEDGGTMEGSVEEVPLTKSAT